MWTQVAVLALQVTLTGKLIQRFGLGVGLAILPVATALVGLIFLGERLSGTQLLAYGLALAGVLLATAPGRRRQT